MDLKLYMLPGRIGLKFNGPAERDKFWSDLSDGARSVAERIGNRTIRFLPDQMKDPTGLIIPMSGNGSGPVAVTQPKPPPPTPQPSIVAAGGDPFAPSGHAVKALPGMVAVASNIAPGMAQERSEAVQTPPEAENGSTGQGTTETASLEATAQKLEMAKDDPEPPDKRTKAYREWWKRNHHGKA